MSNETYIINAYDPATQQIERVTVTKEVFDAFRRSDWNIKDNNKSFFMHEIQMSSLIGGEDGNFENFRELIGIENEIEQIVEELILQEALRRALRTLNDFDFALIYALFYQNRSIDDYAREIGMPATTLRRNRDRILTYLKNKI